METKVLDHGKVCYISHAGKDEDIPKIARVSTGSTNKGEGADKKLLKYLYRNQHSSPFEFCSITYKLDLPLFVRDQIVRHRCGKYNIHSFRYSEPEDKFYIPTEWRKQADKNHQDSIHVDDWNPVIEEASEDVDIDSRSITCYPETRATEAMQHYASYSYSLYKKLIKAGVAREMARMVLGTNVYTSMYIQMDLNNLMKFFKLRLHEHAQFEVRLYAKAMFDIFEQLFPWCAECYKEYN